MRFKASSDIDTLFRLAVILNAVPGKNDQLVNCVPFLLQQMLSNDLPCSLSEAKCQAEVHLYKQMLAARLQWIQGLQMVMPACLCSWYERHVVVPVKLPTR